MARTRAEIYNELLAEKDRVGQLATLTDERELAASLADMGALTSTSKVAVWRLWLYIVSFCAYMLELVFDQHKAEVIELVESAKVHTARWYAERMLEYQHGDELLFDLESKKPYYATIDESKRVIKNVAVAGQGFALVKLKGANGALTASELSGAAAYLQELSEPGAQIGVVSLPADALELTATLYYEPEEDINVIEPAAIAAIESYVTGLPFNGLFQTSDLVKAVKAVPGVADLYISAIAAAADAGQLATVTNGRYYPAAGYMQLGNYLLNTVADV
jgi:hypothetical protein